MYSDQSKEKQERKTFDVRTTAINSQLISL